jgi:hypothetical protein
MPSVGKLLATGEKEGGSYPGYADVCARRGGRELRACRGNPFLPASTVTSTIKNLEKYLKVRLLNRTTRRVSLTPEGMQYLAQCREILALIEHSESSLSESVARPQGRLRVDMPAGIAHFIVMPHLQDFTDAILTST